MPISPFVVGDKIIMRVTKYLSSNPSDGWSNSYEFVAAVAGDESQLLALGTSLVQFEQALHLTQVIFDRLLISTWVADSKPYDPTAFITSSLTAVGQTSGAFDPEPLTTCLHINRNAAMGRSGHLFYRGCLTEHDTTAPAGKSVLVDRPSIQDRIDDALVASNFGDYIYPAGSSSFNLSLIDSTGTEARPVIGLVAKGVTQVKSDHKWFNRAATPTP